MGLITGERITPTDPVSIDQEYRSYEGIGGASQQVITEALVIARYASGDLDTFNTGAITSNDPIEEDVILTGIYCQPKYVAGGTRSYRIDVTLAGENVFSIDSHNGTLLPAVFIPLPNWRIKKDDNLKFDSTVGAGGSVEVIIRFYGFRSA